MSDLIVVWIVEDMKHDAREAWEIIDEITSEHQEEHGLNVEILWTDSFLWPPFANFRTTADPRVEQVHRDDFPDIVVLDLLKRTANAEVLQGDGFYYGLRKWEVSKRHRPSFVVIWSPYQGEKAAGLFLKGAAETDQRLILTPLPTKQAPLLKSVFRELWKLVVEEREAV